MRRKNQSMPTISMVRKQFLPTITRVIVLLAASTAFPNLLAISALAQQPNAPLSPTQQEVISPSEQPESLKTSEPEAVTPAPEQPNPQPPTSGLEEVKPTNKQPDSLQAPSPEKTTPTPKPTGEQPVPSAPGSEETTPASTPNSGTSSPNQSAPAPEANSTPSTEDAAQQKLVEEGLADESEQIPEAQDLEGAGTPGTKALSSSPKGKAALRAATTHLGYVEGKGNANKFSPYFGRPKVAWCAAFVSYLYDAKPIGNGNKRLPWKNPLAVASVLTWGRQTKNIVKQPQPGDLFIMQAKGRSHIGFVRSVKGHIFSTVEGNTTKPGNSRVEGVFSHNRDMRKFPYVFVRVSARTQT